MTSNRLSDFIMVDKEMVNSLFLPFNNNLSICDFSLIDNSMSNTGYVVTTDSGKYFLKLYSNTTDVIETAAYTYLRNKINVPKLYYFDGGKQNFDFSYAIIEYIDGVNLKEYILSSGTYNIDTVYEIGRMLAVIHQKKYDDDAWLGDNLNKLNIMPKTCEHIKQLLLDIAGQYLKEETRTNLFRFIETNPEIFNRISADSVLSHGDINYTNILVSNKLIYFIDFEFAHSTSIYHDIGKFFRAKSTAVQALIDEHTYKAFEDGYNTATSKCLPVDWLELAHICDIESMLWLINRHKVPQEWIVDIEHDILSAIGVGL